MGNTDLAWLAGLWDGEGSVGLHRENRRQAAVLAPQVQIQMTHEPTIARAAELIRGLGCQAVVYRWLERKPWHQDAYGFSIGRTGYVLLIAEALWPFAVTKREHWALVREFCQLRIERMGLDGQGRLRRGGTPGRWWIPYSERELELADALASTNRNGRATRQQPAVGAPGRADRE